MTIARLTPVADVLSLREAMDRLFESVKPRTIKINATTK